MELKKRGLVVSGPKPVLIDRLRPVLEDIIAAGRQQFQQPYKQISIPKGGLIILKPSPNSQLLTRQDNNDNQNQQNNNGAGKLKLEPAAAAPLTPRQLNTATPLSLPPPDTPQSMHEGTPDGFFSGSETDMPMTPVSLNGGAGTVTVTAPGGSCRSETPFSPVNMRSPSSVVEDLIGGGAHEASSPHHQLVHSSSMELDSNTMEMETTSNINHNNTNPGTANGANNTVLSPLIVIPPPPPPPPPPGGGCHVKLPTFGGVTVTTPSNTFPQQGAAIVANHSGNNHKVHQKVYQQIQPSPVIQNCATSPPPQQMIQQHFVPPPQKTNQQILYAKQQLESHLAGSSGQNNGGGQNNKPTPPPPGPVRAGPKGQFIWPPVSVQSSTTGAPGAVTIRASRSNVITSVNNGNVVTTTTTPTLIAPQTTTATTSLVSTLSTQVQQQMTTTQSATVKVIDNGEQMSSSTPVAQLAAVFSINATAPMSLGVVSNGGGSLHQSSSAPNLKAATLMNGGLVNSANSVIDVTASNAPQPLQNGAFMGGGSSTTAVPPQLATTTNFGPFNQGNLLNIKA